MSFFESDIVQEEAKKLFFDYQELMKLGSDYGKFDREGKKMFIKKMESMMDLIQTKKMVIFISQRRIRCQKL